jgi:zinc protease
MARINRFFLTAFILGLNITVFIHDSAHAMPPVQRIVASNGLVVLLSENHSLPFVTFQLVIDAGARRDPPGEEGLSFITARGLLLGTQTRKAATINEELDFMGASLTASSNKDYLAVGLRALKKDLDKAFDLFLDVLMRSTFPEDEIKGEVEKTLAAIQAAEDDPGDVADKAFQKALFLKSPYGHPTEGTKESLPRLTGSSVVRFHREFFRPNHSILVTVGDITLEELRSKIIPALEKWPAGEAPDTAFETHFAKGPSTVSISRQITQANIILGHAGVSRGNSDYYALTVMNYILGGGGFASRLFEEIRVKRGLAYSVASFFDPGKYPGSFQVVLQTKNASAREAIQLALAQLKRIRKEPVSEEELDGARKYLIGSFPMRLDNQSKLANFLSQVEYYGLGMDYADRYPSIIHSIKREDILRVAGKYLHPDNCILAIVANPAATGSDLLPAGP